MTTKDLLILPSKDGVPNLEIRRHQRTIEEQRKLERGVNPQTGHEIAKTLDELRKLADQGMIRALVVVALTRPSREMPEAPNREVQPVVAPNTKVVFSCPRADREMAVDLARSAQAFLDHVIVNHFPPPAPTKPSA